ncbi:hypothetical protein CLV24_104168 [Pontibacter ummariensis]|uniref:Uncharacterized protein n=1 Tax=Pontibacter ummariensis TaxID=1610492 RepID=A0A239DDD5_9BACT|nr:hypothetical protein [Pontibacter ummariensis]PRY14358.1 hypothetical protein CLV24_104168 [Pontibacter ummariensis]SNS30052.1 hypothetical protein SAMN06296052_104167 [Pontibacter ummariensis]
MVNTTQLRSLLKDMLQGKPGSLEDLQRLVCGPEVDTDLLTAPEQQVYKNFMLRHEESKGFEHFTVPELKLFILLLRKANAEAPERDILNRADLTTLSEEEIDTARTVLLQPWTKVMSRPSWLVK